MIVLLDSNISLFPYGSSKSLPFLEQRQCCLSLCSKFTHFRHNKPHVSHTRHLKKYKWGKEITTCKHSTQCLSQYAI
jgi:hypothetical protein